MKFSFLFMVLGLTILSQAFAAETNDCSKLKVTGKHLCSLNGESIKITIKRVNKILQVSAEDETFIINNERRPRYDWSNEFTYLGTCSSDGLNIESYRGNEIEGIISITPNAPSIYYSLTKGNQSLVLECKKI